MKSWSPMNANEEGLSKSTLTNDKHLLNDEYPIFVTEEGINICINELQ